MDKYRKKVIDVDGEIGDFRGKQAIEDMKQ